MIYTSEAAHKNVQASLDSVTSDPKTGVAGLAFAAINKEGEIITANTSVFWIASCTKMVTAIAVMQLVETGKLSLDDHKQLYKLCPELEKVKVLGDDGRLMPREGEITLRKLLSHTAGFGYEFSNRKLKDYGRSIELDVFQGDIKQITRMPLVNQPGSRWEYGVGVDWAGIALERATKISLNEYMRDHIFDPLGLKSTSMFPSEEMKKQLISMHQRDRDGRTEERDHLYRCALCAESIRDQRNDFCSGGAGLFSRPLDYVQILAVLLNGGTSPTTKRQLLRPETVKLMLENQIPEFPNFGRQHVSQARSDFANPAEELYPQEGDPPQGWCLSAMLTIEPCPTGRGKNAAFWAGMPNLFWWLDVEKGVAGMIAGQILPFGDPYVTGQWFTCEKAVYDALAL